MEHGCVNPDYLVVTDGHSFLVVADYNEITRRAAKLLAEAGIDAHIVKYGEL